MPLTPDRFPGGREEESVTFYTDSLTLPSVNGEFRYVQGQGFRFYQEGVVRPIGLVQTVFEKLLTDRTTTSSTFITLFSTTLTTQSPSNYLLIAAQISCSQSSSNNSVWCRLKVDSTVYGSSSSANGGGSLSILERVTGLANGLHTISVEYRVSSGGTARIRPSTFPNSESAQILISEVEA